MIVSVPEHFVSYFPTTCKFYENDTENIHTTTSNDITRGSGYTKADFVSFIAAAL